MNVIVHAEQPVTHAPTNNQLGLSLHYPFVAAADVDLVYGDNIAVVVAADAL